MGKLLIYPFSFQVIRRLVATGLPRLAVRVAAHVSDGDPLAASVWEQAQASLVQMLLEGSGGRPEPMAALRHLESLSSPEEQLGVIRRAITAPTALPQSRMLLRFIMKVVASCLMGRFAHVWDSISETRRDAGY